MKMDGGYVFMLTGLQATIEHTTFSNGGGPCHRGGPGRDGGGVHSSERYKPDYRQACR